jgi:hypothetical protein
VLRRGLSPLATTIRTEQGAPVIAGIRLRAGKANSGKGAASMVAEAIGVARAVGASGQILVRGDSAYGTSAVVGACIKAGARFSVVLTKDPAVSRAIASIPDDAWSPVHYPGAVIDPDTGELISDAEVAETAFTTFASTQRPVTARLTCAACVIGPSKTSYSRSGATTILDVHDGQQVPPSLWPGLIPIPAMVRYWRCLAVRQLHESR